MMDSKPDKKPMRSGQQAKYFMNPGDGGDSFLQITGTLVPSYMAMQPRGSYCS
jgi:hypothetical protein